MINNTESVNSSMDIQEGWLNWAIKNLDEHLSTFDKNSFNYWELLVISQLVKIMDNNLKVEFQNLLEWVNKSIDFNNVWMMFPTNIIEVSRKLENLWKIDIFVREKISNLEKDININEIAKKIKTI